MQSNQGKKRWMKIKVELEKAYYRLGWNFLEDTLKETRLISKLTSITMACVSLCYMKVLWNGQSLNSYNPTREVHQGNPISPYILVLYVTSW